MDIEKIKDLLQEWKDIDWPSKEARDEQLDCILAALPHEWREKPDGEGEYEIKMVVSVVQERAPNGELMKGSRVYHQGRFIGILPVINAKFRKLPD